jgi:hypothetical protein
VRRNRKDLQLLPSTPSTTQPVQTNKEATQELGRSKRDKKGPTALEEYVCE